MEKNATKGNGLELVERDELGRDGTGWNGMELNGDMEKERTGVEDSREWNGIQLNESEKNATKENGMEWSGIPFHSIPHT